MSVILLGVVWFWPASHDYSAPPPCLVPDDEYEEADLENESYEPPTTVTTKATGPSALRKTQGAARRRRIVGVTPSRMTRASRTASSIRPSPPFSSAGPPPGQKK